MQTFVVHIDDPGSAEQPALDAALQLADTDTQVYLFHNVFHPGMAAGGASSDMLLEEARDLLLRSREGQLTALAEEYFAEHAADTAVMWCENGWQSLIKYAAEHGASLLVSRASEREGWRPLRLHQNDWELIRHCPLPLLLVHTTRPMCYEKITAAIDPLHVDDKPASLDNQILAFAAQVTNQCKASLDVVNVVTPQVFWTGGMQEAILTTPSLDPDQLVPREAKIGELLTQHGIEGAEVTLHVGNPSDEIVNHCHQKKTDLLVMGAVSRSTISRLLIGNTAERIIDSLSCDILVVKPPHFGVNVPAINSLLGSHSPLTQRSKPNE